MGDGGGRVALVLLPWVLPPPPLLLLLQLGSRVAQLWQMRVRQPVCRCAH